MKVFIVFVVIFLSFSDGSNPISDNATTTSTTISTSTTTSPTTSVTTTTVSPGADVSINVTWAFTSATSVTSVVMIVNHLKSAQWAAIGLGQAQQMDEAHVFMCKRRSNDTIVLRRYINPGDYEHSEPVPADSGQGGILTLGEQTFVDGVATCRFTLSNFTAQTSLHLKALDPLSPLRSYHPLFAIGSLDDDGEPQQHYDDSRTALSNLVQLNQNETILYRSSISTTTIFPTSTTTVFPTSTTTVFPTSTTTVFPTSTTTVFPTSTTASPTADVSVNVAWGFDNINNVTSVIMSAKNLATAEWVAIGFGQQQLMGEAHVFMCKRLSNDTVVLHRYVNPKDNDYPELTDSSDGGVLTLVQQTLNNDIVMCRFTLSNFTTQKSSSLNVLTPLSQSQSYHPLFAIGLLDTTGRPKKHSSASRTAMADLVQLNQNKSLQYGSSNPNTDNSMAYYQAHGIIMVFAWIFFASTGILITRYFKKSWKNNIVCGEAAWFAAHRFILSIATVLTILGFLFILVASQGTWVSPRNDKKNFIHSITGAIVISFAFFQPFIALFRCKPDSPFRYIYNYLHAFVGFSAFALSIVTVFLATYFELFKDNRARIVMIIWCLWIVLIFIAFEVIQKCFRASRGRSSFSKTSDDTTDSRTSSSVALNLDTAEYESTSGDRLKNVLLALHILFAAIISIVLSTFIG